MSINDTEINKAIKRIIEHYKMNINNRFINKAFLSMKIDERTWSLIDAFTQRTDIFYLETPLENLYEQILALAHFIEQARVNIKPNIRSILISKQESIFTSKQTSDQDKIFREMAINNFPSNLKILSDYVNDLYIKIVEFDKKVNKIKPRYLTIPELKDIGRLLVE